MKKQLLIIPFIFFLLILLIFFYLLIIDRNPFELPSNLLDKNVPNFEAESLLKNENFVSTKEFGNEIILVNFFSFNSDSVSNFGTFLFIKVDGSSIGFLSIISR